jgi:hypothetical protein
MPTYTSRQIFEKPRLSIAARIRNRLWELLFECFEWAMICLAAVKDFRLKRGD